MSKNSPKQNLSQLLDWLSYMGIKKKEKPRRFNKKFNKGKR